MDRFSNVNFEKGQQKGIGTGKARHGGMNATIENGLIVTEPGKCAGYIFNFCRGAYDPNGAVSIGGRPLTQAEVDTHNKQIEVAEVEAMKRDGRAVLYLRESEVCPDGFKRDSVGTWAGGHKWMVCNRNTSRNNMGATRIDLWFSGPDGNNWWGVCVGDSQIVRARRIKS